MVGSEIFPEELGFKAHTGSPGLVYDTKKVSPLSWFKNQWNLQEGCKKPRLCLCRVLTCLLTPRNKAEEVY